MPFYLKELDVIPEIAGLQSVLIVPCRFCPAASLAVKERKPYIELFRRCLRTESYESFIQALENRLKAIGIKTAIFDSKLPHHFVACMWTSQRRERFVRRAAEFDAVIVLGCDAMVESVSEALLSTDCRVIRGMKIEGLMNVIPTLGFPCNISLKLHGITSITGQESNSSQREKECAMN